MEPLTTDQQELAGKGIKTANRIAQRYAKVFPEHAEDLESSATWGTVRAASSWNPDKGACWNRWLIKSVRLEVQKFLRSGYVRHHKPCFEEWIDEAVDDRQVDPACEQSEESKQEIEAMLSLLPERQREVCSLVYKNGITPSQAGVALGFSAIYGRKLHQRAIEWLRKRLPAA